MGPTTKIARLSQRERQIAGAYAAGDNHRQIAERLFIAPSTVRTHLSAIYRKVGVSTKIELLRALEGMEGQDAGAASQKAQDTPEPGAGTVGRRQVTMLSAVIDRFIGLARQLGPEEAGELVELLHDVVVREVRERNGSLLPGPVYGTACFGAPVSDETDAERAVEAAIAIRNRLYQLDTTSRRISVKVGLYTGPAVVKASGEAVDEVIGGATQIAAALARGANHGEIVTCAQTRAILGSRFEFRNRGLISLESGVDSVDAFVVAGTSPSSSRFDALHRDRLTPLAGRDEEVALLVSLFERAREGDGQIALISGEAGIGKSRIVETLRAKLALMEASCLLFQCSPNEAGTSLHPVKNWVSRRVDWISTPEASIQALAALFGHPLNYDGLDHALLSEFAPMRFRNPAALDRRPPERRRAAMLALLTRFVQARSDPGPLLLVFEDIHWADPTTLSWFSELATNSMNARLLTVATSRPEFVFAEAYLPHATSLSLARLTRRQAEWIVRQQPGSASLPSALVDQIVTRSDGVPLFAEELTRSILELDGAVETVPATLQALLMARLDRLGSALGVIQAASVIGRDFDLDLLSALLSRRSRELEEVMRPALTFRLVVRSPGEAQGAYQFKHALVRDSAYGSLVRVRREALHRRLAQVLTARRKRGEGVSAELIAQHLVKGDRATLSIGSWIEAAQDALAKGANREAAHFCREGLAWVGCVSDVKERNTLECDLQLLLYGAEYSRGDVSLLLSILNRAEVIAKGIDDPIRHSKVLDLKAYALASAGRVGEALEAARQGAAISRDTKDLHAIVGANMMLCRALYAAGEYRVAAAKGRLVRDLLGKDLEQGYMSGAMNQTVSSRVWLTFILAELGDFDRADENIKDAATLLEDMPVNDAERLWASAAFARLRYLRQDYLSVIAHLDPLLERCEHDFAVYYPRVVMSLGPSLVYQGEVTRGLRLLARADEIGSANQFVFGRALLLAEHARALLRAGDARASERTARCATSTALQSGENGNAAWARWAVGQSLLVLKSPQEAKMLFEAAAERARQQCMKPLLQLCEEALAKIC